MEQVNGNTPPLGENGTKAFPSSVDVQLPEVGSVTGPVRMLAGTDAETGQSWVRLIFTPPGQVAVLDFPAEFKHPVTGEVSYPADEIADMIRDAARQARSGIIVPS